MASRSASGVDLACFGLAEPKRKSAAAKGQYYKTRTKEWLEKQGYAVARMEHLAWIRRGGEACAKCGQAPMIPTKRDEFGSDLLAIRPDDAGGPGHAVFVQVKLGADQVYAARRIFASFPFPSTVLRWVAVWEKGGHAPTIVDCSADTVESLGPVRRRRPTDEGKLF